MSKYDLFLTLLIPAFSHGCCSAIVENCIAFMSMAFIDQNTGKNERRCAMGCRMYMILVEMIRCFVVGFYFVDRLSENSISVISSVNPLQSLDAYKWQRPHVNTVPSSNLSWR